MQRVQRSLRNIDGNHLKKLMGSISALTKEYETLHSSLFTKDKATITQMHSIEDLKKSKTETRVTYYLILRNLFDTLITAKANKHGDEGPIQALYQLLSDELNDLSEAQLEHPEESDNRDAALDGALQRLVKHTHTIRDRSNITDAYLAEVMHKIQKYAKEYEQSFRHKMSKDHETVNKLNAISIPEDSRNSLDAYHHILAKLHSCLQASKHTSANSSLQSLHKFLVLQLQTQKEAEWVEPCENNGYRHASSSIMNSLQSIVDHSFYASNEVKEFCDQWSISVTEQRLSLDKTWKAICDFGLVKNSALQLTMNEIFSLLGFENDNLDIHKNKQLFGLQKEILAGKELHILEGEKIELKARLRELERKPKPQDETERTELNDLINDTKNNIEINRDAISDKSLQLIAQQEHIFSQESETLTFLSEAIMLLSRNMPAFIIEKMLSDKAKEGGKLTNLDIQTYAKAYYLFILKLQKLYTPIENELNRINTALHRKADLLSSGKNPIDLKKAEKDIAFHAIPTFPRIDQTHNLAESSAIVTSGDDDYGNFKKFLADSFSLLSTAQEYQLALDSLKRQANKNELNNNDFTVSEKYNVTLMSQHKIISTVNELLAQTEAPQVILDAAINTYLPSSTPASSDLEGSSHSSTDVSRNNLSAVIEADIQESDSGTHSPRSGDTQSVSETRDRKLSVTERVIDFVENNSAKRPRPTWQKIAIGLLIGLAAGLVLGGIAAATMVTGGLALEIIIGVSVGLVVAGVVTGTIGGKVHDHRTRDVELAQPSLNRGSSTASILEQRTEEKAPQSVKRVDNYYHAKNDFSIWIKGNKPGLPITVLAPSASPGGQSPRL